MVTASISLLPEVKTFLSQGPLKFHIGGEWVANSSNKTFQTLDPGSGQVLAEVCAGDKSDVDSAVETAKTAFRKSGWATMPVNERCAILQRLADLVENKKPILAQLESLDCGKILANAEGDIDVFINTMRYFVQIAVNASYRNSLAVAEHEAYTSL